MITTDRWRLLVTSGAVALAAATAGCGVLGDTGAPAGAPSGGTAGGTAAATAADGAAAPPSTSARAGGGPASGTWAGTWRRSGEPGTRGALRLVLHQEGRSVTGTVEVGGDGCLTSGEVTGTVNGTSVELHAVTPAADGGQAIGTFTGRLTAGAASGRMSANCSAGSQLGDWQAAPAGR